MKYTQIATDTFEKLQFNAGVLCTEFDPSTGTLSNSNILFATTGGLSFKDTPTFVDYGEDIDNVPNNTMELKRIDGRNIVISGTGVTIDATKIKSLIGAADVSENKITPRDALSESDFDDIWWVGDYSDKNGATNGGFIAIKLMNALSTGGFSIQSGKKSKGQFAFEYTAHYSIDDIDTVPYEVYVKAGTAE